MYSLTVFTSRFDNKTDKRFDFETWDKFSKFLFKLSERPLKGKTDAELISPAVYNIGTTRANKNVLAWSGWCAVDVDDWTPEGDLNDTLIDKFGLWDFICYSTASSLEKLPKFRLVFRLDRNIHQDEIKHFWWALNTELDSIGDRQTKDLSRMYYVPANYSSAFNFIFRNTGIPIDVDELLARHKYDDTRDSGNFLDRLPDEWRKQIIEHRKSSLENTEYSWSGYYDCPFWPKKLASDYTTINNTGWYHKMYQIMIAVAGKAVEKGYPITSKEIEDLCRAFDNDHGRWYENRAIEKEANNALEYVYRNGVF
jgi:hypothetical protein